eukprot:scaffold2668_cov105-Skeletonema_marinoi.AAC.5
MMAKIVKVLVLLLRAVRGSRVGECKNAAKDLLSAMPKKQASAKPCGQHSRRRGLRLPVS